jgi:uncharacterized protein (DUF1501 family)
MQSPAFNPLSRRQVLKGVAGTTLSLNLGGLLAAQGASSNSAAAKPIRSCILIFYYGGPSHLDTFDLKPQAPVEVRGEFQPISTSVPGLQICEHLPKLSRWMHKAAIIRSMSHQARLHDSASIHVLTGRPLEGPDRELFAPQPQFYPSHGGAVSYMRRDQQHVLPFAALPFEFHNVVTTPAQGGGFLGAEFDPLRIEVDPAKLAYQAAMFRAAEDLGSGRMAERRQLLESLDPTHSSPHATREEFVTRSVTPTHGHRLRTNLDRAYKLLSSDAIRQAVDITREPQAVRDRYGFGQEAVAVGEGGGGGNGSEMGYARQMRGQNLLLARRLVEAGVPFVNVYDFKQQGQNWDAHFNNAGQHKNHLLPQADQSLSALIEDLDERGLLDSTLIVALGEFGRTPKINGQGGRDHWPDCYSVLLAGGGVTGGAVYGASDRLGAYPAVDAVTPGDLAATIFWRFGIDPAAEIHDQTGRPHRLAAGEPIRSLFGA